MAKGVPRPGTAGAEVGKARERAIFTRAHFPRGRRPCARPRACVRTTDQLSASCAARPGQSATRTAARRGAHRSGVPAKRQFVGASSLRGRIAPAPTSSVLDRERVAAR